MMRFLQFFKSASRLLSAVSLIHSNSMSLKWPLIVSALVVHQPVSDLPCLMMCFYKQQYFSLTHQQYFSKRVCSNAPYIMSALCTGETTSDDVYKHCAQKRLVLGLWPLAVSQWQTKISHPRLQMRDKYILKQRMHLLESEHIFDIQLLMKSFTIKAKPNSKV